MCGCIICRAYYIQYTSTILYTPIAYISPICKLPNGRRATSLTSLNLARFWNCTFVIWYHVQSSTRLLYTSYFSLHKTPSTVSRAILNAFCLPSAVEASYSVGLISNTSLLYYTAPCCIGVVGSYLFIASYDNHRKNYNCF